MRLAALSTDRGVRMTKRTWERLTEADKAMLLRRHPGVQAKVARALDVSEGPCIARLVGQDDERPHTGRDSQGGETVTNEELNLRLSKAKKDGSTEREVSERDG